MNIQTTTAQAWWIALLDEIRPREGMDIALVLAAVKEAFNFQAIPTGPAKQGGGLEFNNGALRGDTTLVISRIDIYNDGLSIHVPSNTKNAEIILQKTLDIFYSFGVREPITQPLHYYSKYPPAKPGAL